MGGNVSEWNETILNGASRGLRGGSFDVDLDELLAASRYDHEPTYEYDLVGFRVARIPDPTGDADGDGDVDLDDFVILKNEFGSAPPPALRADFDGDGDVDLDDFVILKNNFGNSAVP